ncbi:MAG: nicotinate-nucleotide--dimethylbenzimidazole phosphoribosyltransferase, partial [Candidatus Hydrothermarchaeales archaeon]
MEKITKTIEKIKPLDRDAMEAARKRQDTLTKPQGSLGVLEELSIKVAGIIGKERPRIERKTIITMAGDHGVTESGVSAYPSEVTPQMVFNFLSGGAGINVIARHVGASVVVVDMGVACDMPEEPRLVNKKVGYGTKNITCGPAMTKQEAITSIERGIEIVEDEVKNGLDIVGTGDMGIGNTTPSAAIASVITGISPYEATGRGTGIDDPTFERKVKAIENAISLNNPNPTDGVDVLSKVGGFEIGGIAGVIIGAAANRIPVVIDGYISGAAALIATTLAPRCRDYLIASHLSVEKGHKATLKHLDLKPLFDLNMRLGEGT